MSLANGRFLSDLTEDANNPRGPLQRSYSGQKRDAISKQCKAKINPCVKDITPYDDGNTCKCIVHDLCKQTADGKNCVFVGAEGIEKIQFNFIKQLMNL